MENNVKSTWVKNSLGFDNDLFIYQDKTMFNYSVDTILLANLTSLNRSVKRVLEIGTNNCALSIFLSQRSNNINIDALEIQKDAIELAKYNIHINKLEDKINLIHDDFNLFWKDHCKKQMRKYDSIICNPPFYRRETKWKKGVDERVLNATHEILLNLEQIIEGSSKIISQKGYLSLIIPPERLVDCFCLMRKYNFEPKRVIMIHPRVSQKAILTFVEARFATGWGVHFEPNLYLHSEDLNSHEYLDEIVKLYKPIKVE